MQRERLQSCTVLSCQYPPVLVQCRCSLREDRPQASRRVLQVEVNILVLCECNGGICRQPCRMAAAAGHDEYGPLQQCWPAGRPARTFPRAVAARGLAASTGSAARRGGHSYGRACQHSEWLASIRRQERNQHRVRSTLGASCLPACQQAADPPLQCRWQCSSSAP